MSSVTFFTTLFISYLSSEFGVWSSEFSPTFHLPPPTSHTTLHTLFKNLYAPSTPSSLHSRSFSGGAANREKTLVVSAPYFSIILSGSTVFFFDLLIFSVGPISTGLPHFAQRPSFTSSGKR